MFLFKFLLVLLVISITAMSVSMYYEQKEVLACVDDNSRIVPPLIPERIDLLSDGIILEIMVQQIEFSPQWIEIGTKKGLQTMFLRMLLPSRINLVSFDINQHNFNVSGDLEKYGPLESLNRFEILNKTIQKATRAQIVILRDQELLELDQLSSLLSSLPDMSLLVITYPSPQLIEFISSHYFLASPYWNDLASTIESTCVFYSKKTPFEDREFPWALYPSGISRDFISLAQPLSSFDWLIFLRIQKCGTKSFVDILDEQLSRGASCGPGFSVTPPAQNAVKGCFAHTLCSAIPRNMVEVNQHNCKSFANHHCDWIDLFNVWDLRDENTHAIAIVRNPVGRVISEYKHVYKMHRKMWDYCVSEEHPEAFSRENFLAFLNNPENAAGMRNRQTRMLAGCGSVISCEEQYTTEQQMLEEAKRNLLECIEVGTLESFSDLVGRTNYLFEWKTTKYTIAREERDLMVLPWSIDNEVEQQILALNHLDDELFKFVLAITEYRNAEYQVRTGKQLPSFFCSNHECVISSQ